MAKIQIKSEKLTPFGGLFSIMDQFDSTLSSVIDSTLGLRCRSFGYQYSEIIRWILSFLSSTKVIELDNFSCGRFIVVGQDTTVFVFSFPKILHTIHPFLSLNHKSVCFTLPLLNKDRVQFKLNAIDFLCLPAFESKDVIVERTAAASTDIEGLAVFFYFLHDFLGT